MSDQTEINRDNVCMIKTPRIIVKCKSSPSDKGVCIIAPASWQALLERLQNLYIDKITPDQLNAIRIYNETVGGAQLLSDDWPNIIKDNDILSWKLINKPNTQQLKPKHNNKEKRKLPLSFEPNNKQNNSTTEKRLKRSVADSSLLGHGDNNQSSIKTQDPNHTCSYNDDTCRTNILQQWNREFEQLVLRDVISGIFVVDLSGKHHFIDVDLSESVWELKLRVWKKCGPPPDHQRLIFSARQLEDRRSLADYRIEQNSVIHLVLRLSGGKPVLCLYPQQETQVSVTYGLDHNWIFTQLHPPPCVSEPNHVQWQVVANRNGLLVDQQHQYETSNLFWEADCKNNCVFQLRPQRAICIQSSMALCYLDRALHYMGVDVRNRHECLTYWMAMLTSKPFVAIDFVPPEQIENWAPLQIQPRPDRVIRILLIFEPLNEPNTDYLCLNSLTSEMMSAEFLAGIGLPFQYGRQSYHQRFIRDEHYRIEESQRHTDQFVALEWGGICLTGGLPNVLTAH